MGGRAREEHPDLFGMALEEAELGGSGLFRIERDDGFAQTFSAKCYLEQPGQDPLGGASQALREALAAQGAWADVGAGAGRCAAALCALGKQVDAWEPSPLAFALLSRAARPGLRPVMGSWEDLAGGAAQGRVYGCIAFFGGNAGLLGLGGNPEAELSRASALLSPGGGIFLSGLDGRASDAREHAGYWEGKSGSLARMRLARGEAAGPWLRWWMPGRREAGLAAEAAGLALGAWSEAPGGKFEAWLSKPL